jgi:hypothetical protein
MLEAWGVTMKITNKLIRFLFCIGGILLLAMDAEAAGPSAVAKSSTDLWPHSITSRTDFNTASRAEILIFLSVYKEKFSAAVNAEDLGVKSINTASLDLQSYKSTANYLSQTVFRRCHCPSSLRGELFATKQSSL